MMSKILIKLMTLFVSLSLILSQPSMAFSSEKEAYFAGGCFWCLEHDLEEIPGVIRAESGYLGGDSINPNYENHKGHQESVSVKYDTNKITYEELLRAYWRNIDPFDNQGQFCDRGDSYKPMIYVEDDNQKELADKSLQLVSLELGVSQDELKVAIEPVKNFWIAEDYHQDFAKNNSVKYSFYRFSCGRDYRLDQVWGQNARTRLPWSEASVPNIRKK